MESKLTYAKQDGWLEICNNEYYSKEELNYEKYGKWLIFATKETIADIWWKVTVALGKNLLWRCRVNLQFIPPYNNYVILVYTKDYHDREDAAKILNCLREFEIVHPLQTVYYKANWQTKAGLFYGCGEKASVFDSQSFKFCDKLQLEETKSFAEYPVSF